MSLTDLQLQERVTGIGGSQAAAALGLSPWQSPLGLFLEKTRAPVNTSAGTTSPAMRWGTILEPVVRAEYSQLTNRVVRVPPETLRHAKHTFMLGHVDGITDDKRLFEAKTSRSAEGWGDSGTDMIPHHYEIQVQHYLVVTGLVVADVAVLIGGSDFRLYEIPADKELQQDIIEGEYAFWRCVQEMKAPGPDFDTGDVADLLRRLYPGTTGAIVQAQGLDTEYRRIYEHAANAAKNYERIAEGAKAHLLHQMRDAARMEFPDGVQLTRKLVNRKGYTVEAGQYIDSRFSRIKETA